VAAFPVFFLVSRQVAVHCAERGSLLADIWLGYSSMADAVNGALLVRVYGEMECANVTPEMPVPGPAA